MEEEGASSETIWRSSCQRAPAQWPNRAGAHIDESDPGQMGRQWKSPASTRQCITGTRRMAVSTVDHWDAWQGSKTVPSTISGQNVYPPGCLRILFRANMWLHVNQILHVWICVYFWLNWLAGPKWPKVGWLDQAFQIHCCCLLKAWAKYTNVDKSKVLL